MNAMPRDPHTYDAVVVGGGPAGATAAHDLARQAAAIIRQNLMVSIGIMIVLVISGLFFGLPLPLAVIGHEGGTVLVVLNGLRLLSKRSDQP